VARWQNNEIHNRPGIFIYSVETGRYEQITEFGGRPEWFNDSRYLFFAYQGKIWLTSWQSKEKKPQIIISSPQYQISSAGISPDNRRIFYTATDHQADIFMLTLDK
jgi:Tol biopolymer transport system component